MSTCPLGETKLKSPSPPPEHPATATAIAANTAASVLLHRFVMRRLPSIGSSCAGHRRIGTAGRLAVDDVDQLLVVEDETGERRQRALPPSRVVPQPLALQESAQGPDRQLMRHAQRLPTLGPGPGGVHAAPHPTPDLPRRPAPRPT